MLKLLLSQREQLGNLVPTLLSVRVSDAYKLGEIMITHQGQSLFDKFNLSLSMRFPQNHIKVDTQRINQIGREIVTQLQALHSLGFVHGNLNTKNILINSIRGQQREEEFILTNFGNVLDIFDNQGFHIEQQESSFTGSYLYASDALIEGKTPSRKDDLESLIYILFFLQEGTLPALDHIRSKIGDAPFTQMQKDVKSFRLENKELNHQLITKRLPENIQSAFQYICQLNYKE